MRMLLACLACVGFSESASALSCDFRDRVERTFAVHDARAEHYVVGYGTLVPDGPVPVFDQETQRLEPDRIGARFVGSLAGPGGFGSRTEFEVTVSIGCTVDVCGTVPQERPALMFIRNDGGHRSVDTAYCGGGILDDPGEDEVQRLLACLEGECK